MNKLEMYVFYFLFGIMISMKEKTDKDYVILLIVQLLIVMWWAFFLTIIYRLVKFGGI